MKKSGVRSPVSGVRTKESPRSDVRSPESEVQGRNLETRNSKTGTASRDLGVSKLESPSLSRADRLRTPDSGPRTLVIGYGNPLRSDDGFGWHASRLLAEALAGQDVGAPLVGALEGADTTPAPVISDLRSQNLPVEIITCHQLTPELAERLSHCALAVFLDADAQGASGEIHTRELLPEALPPQAFTHTCTPSGLLASAEQLYGRRPQAFAITVTAQTFDIGETLSPAVAAALPKAVEQAIQLLGLTRDKRSNGR